jgi:hypothetical protein
MKMPCVRRGGRRLIAAVAVLTVIPATAATGADNDLAGRTILVRPEFYMTGIANHDFVDGDVTSYDTFAVTAELTIVPRSRCFWGGPFIDYRTSTDDRFADNLNVGGYFRYNWSRWDGTAWMFVNSAPEREATWIYATRLRYLVAPGHKAGIEALAPLEHEPERPKLMLGYYGSLSDTLTLKLLAGGATGGTHDASVRAELVWRLR